jgi:hypothetical protein
MGDYAALQNAFYKKLLENLRASVGTVANLSNLMPFEQESIGGFAWFWDLQGDINEQTYYLMNTATAYNKDTGAIKASATSATNTAAYIYDALQYRLSETDNTAINQSRTNAATQENTLVQRWNSVGQPQITDAMMKEAGVETRADYIVMHQFCDVWSGGAGKVTRFDILNTDDVDRLFPKMPQSAAPVLQSMVQYVAATKDVATIVSNQTKGAILRTNLVNAVRSPTSANGAISIKNVTSGTKSTVPAWTPQQSTSALQGDLDKGGTFTVTLSVTKEDSNTVKVSVEGSGGGVIPIDFISFFGSAGASYNSFSQKGSGSSLDIVLTYKGVGKVSFDPMQFSESTRKGWYAQKVIAQAYANIGVTGISRPPTSGYVLSGLNQMITMGKNGNAGYINAAVFSNPPSIKLTYKDGNYSTFTSDFKQESSWGVSIFGIRQGSYLRCLSTTSSGRLPVR